MVSFPARNGVLVSYNKLEDPIGMAKPKHDTIARRLSEILTKLNSGERLDPVALSVEFNVHLRTVQRDLNDRLAYLPLIKAEGHYHMDPAYLGKLDFRDVGRFASLVGVEGMFPSLSTDFLRGAFDERVQPSWLVKGAHYENASQYGDVFEQLQQAIARTRMISFRMSRSAADKIYVEVAPYRLLNLKGIWYLAAVHHGRYKSFGISQISSVCESGEGFKKDPSVDKIIENLDSVWYSDSIQTVVLSVDSAAAKYFQRRQLVPMQEITQGIASGSLTVTSTVGHPNQILPIVRYWIPHVRILSPEKWQSDLEDDLKAYLSNDGRAEARAWPPISESKS